MLSCYAASRNVCLTRVSVPPQPTSELVLRTLRKTRRWCASAEEGLDRAKLARLCVRCSRTTRAAGLGVYQ